MPEERDLTPSQDGEAGSGGCDRGGINDGSYELSIKHKSEGNSFVIMARCLGSSHLRRILGAADQQERRSLRVSIRRFLARLGSVVRTMVALLQVVKWMK